MSTTTGDLPAGHGTRTANPSSVRCPGVGVTSAGLGSSNWRMVYLAERRGPSSRGRPGHEERPAKTHLVIPPFPWMSWGAPVMV